MQKLDRRTFLHALPSTLATVGLGSVVVPRLAAGSIEPRGDYLLPAKAKGCIVFFMEGGPSQFDLFSYKPKLNEYDGKRPPEEFLEGQRFAFIKKENAILRGSSRTFSQFGESGMWFSDLLPELARHADRMTMLGAVHASEFNHHPAQLVAQTGGNLPGRPSLGAWLGYGLGAQNPDLPANVALNSSAFVSAGESLWGNGFLPAGAGGVLLQADGIPVLNLTRPDPVSESEEDGTIRLVKRLNELSHAARFDAKGIADRNMLYELAMTMQKSLPSAIDLSSEPPAVLERYGINRSEIAAALDPNHKPLGGFSLFARHCLMARRLIEEGVRCVNIVTGSWDMHANLAVEMPYFAGMIDQPIAALLDDLNSRGLLDETLVVFASEFGRTPLGEAGGRDHHPNAFNVWMAGGGVQKGLTFGETDELGWEGVSNRVSVGDLHATILQLLGIDHTRLVFQHAGVEQRLTPITEGVRIVHEIIA